MFSSVLPEEMERMIWKFYFDRHVLTSVKEKAPLWSFEPSDTLVKLCGDNGCIQHRHTDLERALFYKHGFHYDYREMVRENCFDNKCNSCVRFGFPCVNACRYAAFSPRMIHLWKLN